MTRNTKTYTRPILAIVCEFVTADAAYSPRMRTRNRGVTVEVHMSIVAQYCCHNPMISPSLSSDTGGTKNFLVSVLLRIIQFQALVRRIFERIRER